MPQAARDDRVQWRSTGSRSGFMRGAFVAAYDSVLPLTEDDAGSLEDGIEAHVRSIRWPG